MSKEKKSQKYTDVPYQYCPVCEGTGQTVTVYEFMSPVYQICKVCNGAMIIPMHSNTH